MPLSRSNLWNTFGCFIMVVAAGLVGCGDTCFVAFSNNGKGGLVVKAGNPPPSCSVTQAKAAIRVVVLKSPICETCTAATRVEHVVVTLRGIQLQPSVLNETNSADWVEVAPLLTAKPLQIDIIGNSLSEIPVDNAIVPAGNYREVRLQFLPESLSNTEEALPKNPCGEGRWNCIVTADGRIEPLHFSGDVPQLDVAIENGESDSLVLLPDSDVDLRLSLQPHQIFYSSTTEVLKLQSELVGRVTVVPQRILDPQRSN